jgi:hypothetical protein
MQQTEKYLVAENDKRPAAVMPGVCLARLQEVQVLAPLPALQQG